MATAEEARQIYEDGIDAYRAGDYEEALESLGRARDLFAAAGDRKGQSEALNDMGVVLIQDRAWTDAHQCFDEALAIRRDLGDRSAEGITLGNLGMLYAQQGDQERAAEAYGQAIQIFREMGERGNEQAVSRQLSKLKLKKGKVLDALEDYREDLAMEQAPSGAQAVARKLFGLFGWVAGRGMPSVEYDEDDEAEDEDVIDVTPEPPEEIDE